MVSGGGTWCGLSGCATYILLNIQSRSSNRACLLGPVSRELPNAGQRDWQDR